MAHQFDGNNKVMRNETSIKIAGDIFGMEEYDPTESLRFADVEKVTRTTTVVAISQVKVLAISFDQYRRVCKMSQNEE